MAPGGLYALLTFANAVFAVIAAIWTYSDASKHSSYSAFLWAVVVFFLSVAGVALYLMLGRDELPARKKDPDLENVRTHDSPFDPKR